MNEMFAQGDLLIERVADVEPTGTILTADQTGAVVLAEGVHGHRHAIYDRVTMFETTRCARDPARVSMSATSRSRAAPR
jgi:hypothetical protein